MVSDLLNIESEIVNGNVRISPQEIGKYKKNTNHAWNVIKIDNKWITIDATWAAGFVINGKWERKFSEYFFNIPLSKINKTHFPDS